jgi:hypothetical protein
MANKLKFVKGTAANIASWKLSGAVGANDICFATDTLVISVGDKSYGISEAYLLRIKALEDAVGAGGSVTTQITNAINALDLAQVAEEGKFIKSVKQEDGFVSAELGSVEAQYVELADEEGLFTAENVEAALAELIKKANANAEAIEAITGEDGSMQAAIKAASDAIVGTATSDYNTLGKVETAIKNVADAAKSYSMQALTAEELAALGEANVKEAYKLVDEDGTQAGSTVKIYKDSALQSVSFADQKLSFVYNLADGSSKTVDVDVSSFLAENEFGNGLVVTDHVVSVALADHVEGTNDNYLVMEEGKLAVREIEADDTKLKKPIVVAGLSGQFGAGNYSNGNTIPAGTDIQTILQNLLCKELYPTPTSTDGTISNSIAQPTVTLSHSGTIEVGTEVSLNSASVAESTVSTTPNKVTGMTNGYSAADDDSVDSTATSVSKEWSTSRTGNAYSMSATVTKFNGGNTTATTPATVATRSMAATTLGYAAEGTNKLKVSVTGDTFTGSVEEIPVMYLVSNLGNTEASKKTTKVNAQSNITPAAPTNSKEVSVTGKYKYFLGYSDNTTYNQFNSESVRKLTAKTDWIEIDGTTTIVSDKPSMTSNGKSIVVACPAKYKLATIQNGVGANILPNFTSVGNVDVTTGSITTSYKVYVYPITNGAAVEFKNVTLTKA